MLKLKGFYIFSLALLALLIGFTVFRPMASGQEYSEVQREQILETEDRWIIEFDIMNHEGKEANYTINLSVDGEPSTLTVSVMDEATFTYIKHINKSMLTGGKVDYTVYKEMGTVPLEASTYYLK